MKKRKMKLNCSIIGCKNYVTDGAHVQRVDSSDKSWYIVPMCAEHNRSKDFINEILDIGETELVPANVSETC